MTDHSQPHPNATSMQTAELTDQEKKYGKSIFKKWIYAKFDAKLILEVVQKDIYFNPKLAILLPETNANGKKKFISATLDLKALKNLQTEVASAIALLEEHQKTSVPEQGPVL